MESLILSAFGDVLEKSLPVSPPATSPYNALQSLLFVVTEELDLLREEKDEMSEECVYIHIVDGKCISFHQGNQHINNIMIDVTKTRILIRIYEGLPRRYNTCVQVLIDKLGVIHPVSHITLRHNGDSVLTLLVDEGYGTVHADTLSLFRISSKRAVKFFIEIIDKCNVYIAGNNYMMNP